MSESRSSRFPLAGPPARTAAAGYAVTREPRSGLGRWARLPTDDRVPALVAFHGYTPTAAGVDFSAFFVVRADGQVVLGRVSDAYGRDLAIAGAMVLGGAGLSLLVLGDEFPDDRTYANTVRHLVKEEYRDTYPRTCRYLYTPGE